MASMSKQAKEPETRALEQHQLPRPVRRAVRRDALRAVWRAEPQLAFAGDGPITTSERQLYFVERNAAITAAKLAVIEETAPTVARLLELRANLQHLADRAEVAAALLAQHPAADQRRRTTETLTPEAVVAARRRREHAASVARLTAQLREARAAQDAAHAEATRLAAQLRTKRDAYQHRVDDLCEHAMQKRQLFDTVLCQGRQESTILRQRLDHFVPPVPDGLREFELPDLSFLDEASTDASHSTDDKRR